MPCFIALDEHGFLPPTTTRVVRAPAINDRPDVKSPMNGAECRVSYDFARKRRRCERIRAGSTPSSGNQVKHPLPASGGVGGGSPSVAPTRDIRAPAINDRPDVKSPMNGAGGFINLHSCKRSKIRHLHPSRIVRASPNQPKRKTSPLPLREGRGGRLARQPKGCPCTGHK